MSVIARISAAGPAVARFQRSAPDGRMNMPVPAQPVRAEPLPRTASADAVRDARFDAAPSGANAPVVRQLVQQITATLAYGAHVSVVSTATTVHATIDVSG